MPDRASVNEFPAGRLSSFEDDSDTPDLSTLLRPRKRARDKPSPDDPNRRVFAAQTPADAAPEPAAVTKLDPPAPQPESPLPEPDRLPTPKRRVIKPSSVHIPADLIEKLKRARDAKRWSNGQIIIAALEACADTLSDLIAPTENAGGGLFAPRASRGVRTAAGPLTALNIRLYEQDYEVIDSLVEKYGAYSRGHLISVALTQYLA